MLQYLLLNAVAADIVSIDSCPKNCSNHGNCYELFEANITTVDSYLLCVCSDGFVGDYCEQCAEGRFGALCKECPQPNHKLCGGHGVCDSGVTGSGECVCEEGFTKTSHCSEEETFLDHWPALAGGTSVLILAAILCIFLILIISYIPIIPRSSGAILLGVFIGFCYYLLKEDASFSQTLLFKPEVFFLLLIPPIMFEAGFSLNNVDFFNNIGTILLFAIFGTLLTAVIFGIVIFIVCNVFSIYPFMLIETLLFGALISATDPVATISINKLLRLNKNLTAVILGESVLNDAISIALFKVFSEFITDKDLLWASVITDFIYVFFGSISIGFLSGLAISVVFKLFRFSPMLDSALFIIWVYIPYLVSEAIGMSGILAILFLGMTMGNITIHSLSPVSKTTIEEIFNTFAFVAENFCFVYFGISMAIATGVFNLKVILVGIAALLVTRALVIFLLSPLCNLLRTHRLSFAEQVIIWLSGARGAIAFSLALSLPLDNSEVIITTTQYLVLFTTVVLGMVSFPIAKRFNLEQIEDESEHPIFSQFKIAFEGKIKKFLVRKNE